jgi:hypothetical protein
MGRTYRRNPDDYYSSDNSKSLREKRLRGGTRSNWDTYESKESNKNKLRRNQENGSYNTENYTN